MRRCHAVGHPQAASQAAGAARADRAPAARRHRTADARRRQLHRTQRGPAVHRGRDVAGQLLHLLRGQGPPAAPAGRPGVRRSRRKRRTLVERGVATRSRRRPRRDGRHHRQLPATSTGARGAERDGRLRLVGRCDLPQSADRYHRAIDPCHRRGPGRWLNPPRAAGADHGKCAHLDGRAGLSTEPAEQPAPHTMPSSPPR